MAATFKCKCCGRIYEVVELPNGRTAFARIYPNAEPSAVPTDFECYEPLNAEARALVEEHDG